MPDTSKEEHVNSKMEYAKILPDVLKASYLKTATDPKAKVPAIKAMCQHCVGYEEYSKRIRECTVYICPLWLYRPYQIKEDR